MSAKIEKIKTHFKENKEVYIASGITFVATTAGVLLYARSNSGAQFVQKINQIGFRNEANQVIVNLVERSTPSKPVHLVGTNLYFDSLHDAARKTGHNLSKISRHINGKLPDLNGDVFEVLEKV